MRTQPDSRRHLWTRLIAALSLVGLAAPGGTSAAEAPVLACSADRSTLALGESVVMRAWVGLPPERVARYAWDVRVGGVTGNGREVRWDLAGIQPGQYAAVVKVHDRGGRVSEECVLRIVVRRDAAGRGGLTPNPGSPAMPSRETGGAFLVSTQTEAAGYGLYSYLLFGSPPAAVARDRHVKALEAFVGLIPDIAALERYVPARELNIAYVPLETDPGAQATADRLLAQYDYARARSVLRLIPGGNREGPYVVSALRPLGGTAAATVSPNPYLFQDLSTAPPHLVAAWVKEFLNQAAQERFWEARSAERLALKLRVTVGVLGMALPEVKKALDTWIAWVR